MNSELENASGVVCMVCEKEFKIISPSHLRKEHGLSMDEYKERYPNASISSANFRNKQKIAQNARFNNDIGNLNVVVDEPSPSEDLTKTGKDAIFDYLKPHFRDLKKGRVVDQSPSGGISFSLILDMYDKSRKIAFNFKEAIWHAHDYAYEAVKTSVLKKHGWTVYEVLGVNPSVLDVKRLIE